MASDGPTVLETVMAPIEGSLYSMGLMENEYSPLLRFSVAAVGVGALLYWLKPTWAFVEISTKDRKYVLPREWRVTADPRALEANPQLFTSFPWWMAALASGAVFALFV